MDPELLAAVSTAVKADEAPETTEAPAEAAAPEAAAAPAEKEDLIGTPPADDKPTDGAPARGSDGKFVAKAKGAEKSADAPADKPAATAKPAEAPKPAEPPKAADHVNDPIPDNVKASTRERITSLVDTVKATSAELETARAELETTRGDFDLLAGHIRDAGASVEQFQESMNLLKMLNSPHQHEQMQALQYLQGATAALAERLGQAVPGTDPLDGFPDLKAQVNANPGMRKMAEEAAAARRLQAASTRHGQQVQARSQQEQQAQQARAAAQAALRELETTLESSDPQFKAKLEVLRKDAAFMNEMRAAPPATWTQRFAAKYRTVKVAAPAPAAPAASNSPAPLRGKTPAGTAAKPPASPLDAVRGALALGA